MVNHHHIIITVRGLDALSMRTRSSISLRSQRVDSVLAVRFNGTGSIYTQVDAESAGWIAAAAAAACWRRTSSRSSRLLARYSAVIDTGVD